MDIPPLEFTAHTGMVRAIAISRRGDLLATAGDDQAVNIWRLDSPSKKPHKTFGGQAARIRSLAFSEDGSFLLVGYLSGTVKVLDVESGAVRRTITAGRSLDGPSVPHPALAPGGRFLAWIRRDGYEVWDLAAEKQVASGSGSMRAEDAALSPDGKTLSIAGGAVRVIDTASGEGTSIRRGMHYRATAISPDGRYLAVSDVEVPIIDLETGKQIGTVVAGNRWVRSIAFSQDASAVAMGFDAGKVVVRRNPVTANSITLDSNRLVLKTDEELRQEDRERELQSAREAVVQAQVALDRGAFARASELASRSLRVIPETIEAQEILAAAEKHLRDKGWHRDQVSCVELSSNGRWLVSGGDDHMVKVWDLTTRKVHADLAGHGAWVRSVTLSDDDTVVVSASQDGVIKKWDADSGTNLETITLGFDRPRQIALSQGGKYVAVFGGEPQRYEVWDLEQKERIAGAPAEELHAESMTLSPDGEKLAIAGGRIFVAATKSGQWTDVTPGQAHFRAVAFSPDGTILAASPGDVLLMDSQTNAVVSQVAPNDLWVRSISLSSDNGRMTVGLDDGRILVLGISEKFEPVRIGYASAVD